MHLLAETTAGSSGWIIAVVISILTGLVSALVLLNLNGIKASIDKMAGKVDRHDERLGKIEKTVADRKSDCMANFVSREDWVRAEGYSRQEMKEVTGMLHRLDGKLDVVNRLPEISAQIAAQTVERVLQEVKKS